MPKAGKNSTLNRAARRVAATPLPIKEFRKEEHASEPQTLSRGQRKRQAKREKFLQKERLILSTLKLKSAEEQKKRIDGLDAIKDALMNTTKVGSEIGEETIQVSQFNSNKSKKRLVGEEVEHMGLVLQHPAFQANPFETLQQHLRNTLADDRDRLESQAEERRGAEKTKQEEQKRQKKERLQGIKKSKKKYKAGRSRS